MYSRFYQKKTKQKRRILIGLNFTVALLLPAILFLQGCSPKEPRLPDPLPEQVIPFSAMVEIMTDCFLAEGAVKQRQIQHKNAIKHTNAFYNFIFEKHGVDYNSYKMSLEFYHAYPAEAEKMYTLVLENLSKREAAINNSMAGNQ
ncbi:MAG: DUF4296 domain-containing protein [Bacteroidia bacterium]|nr:DUF4296 domain-containing protein [Bacteroidales bacterium]MDD3960721.1 DUF4296 domain-containing protein [Bacteroidales bacterium]NCD42459.1 DUF4296 domain-containing protein [Bacteroidia bacterium]